MTRLLFAWILLAPPSDKSDVSDRSVASDSSDESGWIDPYSALIPPQFVGYTERPPLHWGEAGNQDRSVQFVNDFAPFDRYYLRVFLDNEALVLTDGVGVYEALVSTGSGARLVSVLPPGGSSYHVVNVGRHKVIAELFAGPEPLQYVMTCVWQPIFEDNLGLKGEWHFWGGRCQKSRSSR